ncbi:phosphoribosylglycinamide formyltransferase [Paenibacillus sp. NPDC058174]|uniref:phosphoribosylglycinamide formyltransferase n=1 Tax=Paenibacillus sp. NPDC058174 TaxID=3346366 RepID=UPI0036D79ECA
MGALRLAVFASGQGTNFQALADAVQQGGLDATIELLVCDKPSAPVVERAKKAGIEAFVFKPKDYPSREAYETEILVELERRGVELIVLAGYMRIITPVLVEPYYGRMINIHPSLLPSFPGVNGIGQALEYGVKVTGVTVHYVDGGLDSGPIIAQRTVEVLEGDTEASLAERIHAAEQQLLPQVAQWIAQSKVTLNGRHVTLSK